MTGEDGKRERKKQKIDAASDCEAGQNRKEKEKEKEKEAELKKRQNGAHYPNTKELIFGPILEGVFYKVIMYMYNVYV
jgi:hypothetical protein